MRLPSDPHFASEAVIWGGGGGEAGERNQKPAEDVPHHVYSSSTAHLHVLAHLPPHQIKPGTLTQSLCRRWTWLVRMPSHTLKYTWRKTHTHTHIEEAGLGWNTQQAAWMMSHHFPRYKDRTTHSQDSLCLYAWSYTTHATRWLREDCL